MSKELKAMCINLPTDLVARVDAVRGDIPRSKYIQRALEKALKKTNKEAHE
jgi:metal-responsive CopG/Arc/MetJ family transcriptional regulator